MIEESIYNIKLEKFEGPFDLLITLLEKNKMDIMEIQISEIADQYVDYLFSQDAFNMDCATEFLVMAATLLQMKSRKLLPQEEKEEEELTEEELKERLIRYKRFKEVSKVLAKELEFWNGAVYFAGENLSFKPREIMIDLNKEELANAYSQAMARYKLSRNDNTEKMQEILRLERVSLRDKIRHVINVVRERTKVAFSEMFNLRQNSKMEVVTGFLAVLELDKCKQVELEQEKVFDEIQVKYRENPETESLFEEMEEDYD